MKLQHACPEVSSVRRRAEARCERKLDAWSCPAGHGVGFTLRKRHPGLVRFLDRVVYRGALDESDAA
jgi:hypothetical protein